MSIQRQHRRGNRADLEAGTPAEAEYPYDQDLKSIRAGDGATLGGHLLAKWGKRHVIVPTALAADADDYAPTDFKIAEVLALDSDADYSITGLAGGAANRIVTLVNKGDFRLTLSDQDAASTANNRFDFGFNLVLRPRQAVTLAYDTAASRWAISHLGLFSVTDLPENVTVSGVSTPAQITATQDDYAPSNMATAAVLRLSSDASRNITGLVADATARLLTIINVGSSPIVLQNANSNSAAANRFDFGGDVTLDAKQTAVIWYDLTSSRWRLLSAPPTAGASDVPADLSLLLGQLALAVADNANVAEFLGDAANRVADSFDALTYVDTGSATNLDSGTAGILKPSSTSGSLLSSGGTNIGDLTATGGLAAAFNGTTTETVAGCAAKGAASGYIGKDWGSGVTNTVGRYKIWSSSNQGFSSGGTTPTVTLTLRGSNDGSAWTTLHTDSFADVDASQIVKDYTSGIDVSAAYRYHSVLIETGNDVQVAELELYSAPTINNLAVNSVDFTAASAPSSAKLVARVKEIDAITLNTDLIFYASRDGGTTYTAFAMTKKFTANLISVYESDSLDISAQPTGTAPKWKVVSANGKDFELHDIYLYWS